MLERTVTLTIVWRCEPFWAPSDLQSRRRSGQRRGKPGHGGHRGSARRRWGSTPT